VQLWDFSDQGKSLTAGLVKQAGLGWISEQIPWSAVELAPGQFDWSEVDAIVSAAQQSGLRVPLQRR
jgi:beta-galactosidase GanA